MMVPRGTDPAFWLREGAADAGAAWANDRAEDGPEGGLLVVQVPRQTYGTLLAPENGAEA